RQNVVFAFPAPPFLQCVLMAPAVPQSPAIITGLHAGPVRAEPLTWPAGCGGECIFLGRTRLETHPQHGRLLRLAYEAYEPMAASLLEAMAKGTLERFGCGGVRVVHAIGVVPPGEASVVIQ